MPKHDLSTAWGRFQAYWDYWWGDHAFLRVGFTNAHWIGPDMLRTNQPWPFQLKQWKKRGIKTVINLRGGLDASFYSLEQEACERLGLNFVTFVVTSREIPSREQVFGAREMFKTIEYPALMHCKSGADRAGIMGVLYRHFHLGEPIAQALAEELTIKKLHVKAGKTGVLDYVFERYLEEVEPKGISFEQWVASDAYDPKGMKAKFRAEWWGTLLSEKFLKRE